MPDFNINNFNWTNKIINRFKQTERQINKDTTEIQATKYGIPDNDTDPEVQMTKYGVPCLDKLDIQMRKYGVPCIEKPEEHMTKYGVPCIEKPEVQTKYGIPCEPELEPAKPMYGIACDNETPLQNQNDRFAEMRKFLRLNFKFKQDKE